MAASMSLIIEDDAGKQIVVPFAKDVITIGRKEGNTIRLTERNVSRFHAKLEKQQGGVLVEDLSSFNGVKLNGDRIAGRVLVSAGDVIEIGDYHLELRAAQMQKPVVGPIGSKAGSLPDAAAAGGDDFEGDTQRWEPPSGAAPHSQQLTQEDTMPHQPAGGGFADGAGDTEKLDLQHLQALVSRGGQTAPAPPPQVLVEPQSWPPPSPREAPPPSLFGASDLEATARQPVSHVPLGGIAPPPMAPSMAPPPVLQAPSRSDETQDMPLPMAPPPPMASPAVTPALAPVSAPPRAPPPRRVEETEQMKPAPAPSTPADDLTVPRIVVLNTIFAGSTFALRAMENVLGRTDENDIVLEHRSVSRNHAKLVREGERVRILDLKSANGVLVNGAEVETHVLKAGDIIELGRLKIRFVPVGERFVVPPDEIERARVADAAGDESFDDASHTVNVTSPLRQPRPSSDAPAPASKPVALYAMLGVLVVIVIILAVVVITRGGDATLPPPEPTPTPVGALPTEPPPPPVTPPPPPVTPPATTAPVVPDPDIEPVATEPETKPTPTAKKKDVPLDFEASLKQAQEMILTGKFKEAVPLLKDLERANPDEPRVHRNLGIGYAKLRDNASATKHYRRYLELAPNAPDAEKVRAILKK